MIVAAFLDALGRLLAVVRLSPASADDRTGLVRLGAAGIALLTFAVHVLGVDWSPLAAALATIAAMAALQRERALLRRAGGRLPRWIADGDALVLLFAAFAAAQVALPGLLVLPFYAAASFAAVQHQLGRLARS